MRAAILAISASTSTMLTGVWLRTLPWKREHSLNHGHLGPQVQPRRLMARMCDANSDGCRLLANDWSGRRDLNPLTGISTDGDWLQVIGNIQPFFGNSPSCTGLSCWDVCTMFARQARNHKPERGVVMLAAVLFFVLAPVVFFLLTRSVD